MQEYKGYHIVIDYIKNAPIGQKYIARTLTGGISAYGENDEDAFEHLKSKIDVIPSYISIYKRPLDKDEIEELEKYCKDELTEIYIRQKLVKNHYFTQNDFSGISIRAILNHTDIIESALNECNNDFKLDFAKLSIGTNEIYAVYDEKYFDTDSKIKKLKQLMGEESLNLGIL